MRLMNVTRWMPTFSLAYSVKCTDQFYARIVVVLIGISLEDEGGLLQEETKYYQDARGWIPLNPADLDARWAVELNETQAYAEQIRKRKTVIEGVSACQDRLGWSRCKLRGVWKVDCEGFLASLAHNILKLVRKLKARLGIPLCYGGQGMETEGVPTY
jgi:hypothetical protein